MCSLKSINDELFAYFRTHFALNFTLCAHQRHQSRQQFSLPWLCWNLLMLPLPMFVTSNSVIAANSLSTYSWEENMFLEIPWNRLMVLDLSGILNKLRAQVRVNKSLRRVFFVLICKNWSGYLPRKLAFVRFQWEFIWVSKRMHFLFEFVKRIIQ